MSNSSGTAGVNGLPNGKLGTGAVVFMVVAAASPLATVVALLPLSIVLGNGIGTPGAYLLVALVLACFATGYVAMGRHVTNAGAFYAYVGRGFGAPFGMSAAFVALVAYAAMSVSLCGLTGYLAEGVFDRELSIHLPWEAWSMLAIVVIAVLAHREIIFSAGLLAIVLGLELALVLVFDVAVLTDLGFSGFSLDVFAPDQVFGGAAGVSFAFAFGSFIGFEATAIYAEEARGGQRTVRRATYAAVALIGGFYVLTTWAAISAYGAEATTAAGADPASFFPAIAVEQLGGFAGHAMDLLLVNSAFAAFLAFYNALSRYLFALARDGVLPGKLAQVHPRHGSPWVAAMLTGAIVTVVVAAYAIADQDPYLQLTTSMLGLGTLGLVCLQAAASFAAVRYLGARRGEHSIATVVAAALGGLGLTAAAVLIVRNYDAFTGAQSGVLSAIPWLLAVVAIAGVAVALRLRRRSPGSYAKLGQSIAPEPSAA